MRYALEAGLGDSGFRVSLRRRLAAGGLGDVLGELLHWTEDEVAVRREDGTEVLVRPADVVAVRRVPPRPERRRATLDG